MNVRVKISDRNGFLHIVIDIRYGIGMDGWWKNGGKGCMVLAPKERYQIGMDGWW